MRKHTTALVLLAGALFVANAQAKLSPDRVAFWAAVGRCEQPGAGWLGVRWDHPGPAYQGGLGFAASTWDKWSSELRPGGKSVHDRFPDMGDAPPRVQMWVAEYGLHKYGKWGCVFTLT